MGMRHQEHFQWVISPLTHIVRDLEALLPRPARLIIEFELLENFLHLGMLEEGSNNSQ